MRLLVISLILVLSSAASAAAPEEMAQAELKALSARVKKFKVVDFAWKPGELRLTPVDSLTIDDLRGVALDDAPPQLIGPAPRYAVSMADDCPAHGRPYVARDIAPFRFRHFHCEFNYGGWHNFDMQDYASTHGFDVLLPYIRKPAEMRHWPRGTQVLRGSGEPDWERWMARHGIPAGRYDRLADMDLVKLLAQAGLYRRPQGGDVFMIDLEHSVLSPGKLREQPWYPKEQSADVRVAFEKKYYAGYAQTYVSAVLAAKRQGWPLVSVYGWAPYGRPWGGLEKAQVDPGTNDAWDSFGRRIYDAVDIINNSVYCFYWSAQNVAYVLASIDNNIRFVKSAGSPKPVRPYFMTILHGGGGGWRWWREQPLSDEEERAMTAMAFFTGIDGLDTWNWSGTGSHHVVALSHAEKHKVGDTETTTIEYHDVMVARAFSLKADDRDESFKRYDVLHVLGIDQQGVRFQKIRPAEKNNGVDGQFPIFGMPREKLLPLLRPKSEPVAATVEGLALVKPFEYILRHGEVKIDVPAAEQFAKTLPIVRRVKLGRFHVLITYDPGVVHGGAAREIVLKDFDGSRWCMLRLPADEQTRVFVLRESAP